MKINVKPDLKKKIKQLKKKLINLQKNAKILIPLDVYCRWEGSAHMV